MIAVLVHYLIDPVSIAILVLVAALVAEHQGRRALSRGLVIATALTLAAFALLPFDALIAKPLEDRYPRAQLPAHVDGIVVLSGGLRFRIFHGRGANSGNATLLRMTAAADLARRYPTARLIFSGVSEEGERAHALELVQAKAVFASLGIAPDRPVYELRSRDTWENLNFSKALARPKPGETWVLVTSAMHMPRAMAMAKSLGWTMLPWPSDYETALYISNQPLGIASHRLETIDHALHEWIGLLVFEI